MKQKIFLVAIAAIIAIQVGCKKEEGTTTYVDGNNISIGGDTSHISYSYIDNYNSGNSSELVSSLQFVGNSGGSWATGEVIYSLLIPSLKTGDVVFAQAQSELTGSFSGFNVLLFGCLLLTDNPTQLPGSSGTTEISEQNGYNITDDAGHAVSNHSGSFTCLSDLGDKRINFCLRAETSANSSGSLTVEQDYGRLIVTVFRK